MGQRVSVAGLDQLGLLDASVGLSVVEVDLARHVCERRIEASGDENASVVQADRH